MNGLAAFNCMAEGGDKYLNQAGVWFQKAAEMRYLETQLKLGEIYASRQGRPQNRITAYS